MGKKLFEKAGLIGVLPPNPQVLNRSTPPLEAPARPKTAPGTMLGFMSAQSTAIQEAESLREKLSQYEGAAPVRALDPTLVVPSKWANRDAASFTGEKFEALKAEIGDAGGNVQPIKVRPRGEVLNGSTPPAATYEIIYGHRRHRACLELGLPVLALIEEASDLQLFVQMERENRGRENLSAWEQGMMYRQALDEGLYPSLRKLADGVNVDLSLVSKSVALARLPEDVIRAFASPLEIQYRWAQPLSEVQQKDPERLLALAASLSACEPKRPAAQVFAVLTGSEVLNGSTPSVPPSKTVSIKHAGQRVGSMKADARGRSVLTLDQGVLGEAQRRLLVKVIEDFLARLDAEKGG